MYQDETNQLYNKANLTRDLYNQDYQQYRDKKSDYYTDRDYFTNFYNNERNFDYGKFRDDRNYYASEYWNQRNAEKTTDTSNWSHTDTWSDTDSSTDSTSTTNSYTESGGSSGSGSKSKSKDNEQEAPKREYTLKSDNVQRLEAMVSNKKNAKEKANALYDFVGKKMADGYVFTEGDYIFMKDRLGA
jgi:hypothetical protein